MTALQKEQIEKMVNEMLQERLIVTVPRHHQLSWSRRRIVLDDSA